MLIYLGADHRGFKLKEDIKEYLKDKGYELVDLGNSVYDENDDYPDFAVRVAKEVSKDIESLRGIIICGSGAGMCIAANKIKRIRAAIGFAPDQIYSARRDDDVNILCLPADFLDSDTARKIVDTFLLTPFNGDDRLRRRIEKISLIENE